MIPRVMAMEQGAVAVSRKVAAILVADIVGYSRLVESDEEGTLTRLRELRADVIDPATASHNGRIVKRLGDGAITEFRSVVEAVRCAKDVLRGLASATQMFQAIGASKSGPAFTSAMSSRKLTAT